MKSGGLRRLSIIIIAFGLGLAIEYLWLGKDAFAAFGVVMAAFFVAPISLLLIYIDQKFIAKK